MSLDAIINEALRERVGLRKLYPYSLSNITHCTAYADVGAQAVAIAQHVTRYQTRLIIAIYLHEVGHIIAGAEGIDHDPGGRTHNRFFACLVAVMYRRLDLLDHLKTYDFADTEAGQKSDDNRQFPADSELARRYAYIIRRSAQLAPLPLSIEQIARKLYREDVCAAWCAPAKPDQAAQRIIARDAFTWLLGFAVGIITTAAAAAVVALR